MEQTPPPVDINTLRNILGKAKQVMNKVEDTKPIKSSSNGNSYVAENYEQRAPIYNPNDEREPVYATPTLADYRPTNIQPVSYSKEHIMASNLPPAIKEAMIKKPIQQLSGPNHTFSLQDIGPLEPQPARQQQPRVNEGLAHKSGNMITISEGRLNEMIEEKVNEVLQRILLKNITEQTIKKTVTTLMREGKLITKKKI
jgi:hypothetical protein